MSLSAVYLQGRLQLLERHIRTLAQMMEMRQPDDACDLASPKRVWEAKIENMNVALLRRARRYFERLVGQVNIRREER